MEGNVEFLVPAAGKPCKTWYIVFGDLKSRARPLVVLHGGPGYTHNYLLHIQHLASTYGIPVIFYDQVGCGNSTRLKEKAGDAAFWTVDLFNSELENLLRHLGINEDYDVLGQSWGGMLGACHAIRQPKGLNKLIIADSPANMETWVKVANELREQLPKDVQETLLKHERDGTTDSEEYEAAVQVYYDRHLCRVRPAPQELVASEALVKEDPTVYMTMNGPSEFFVTGTLKHFSIEVEIHKITTPTLLINGKFDEAQDEVMEPYFKSIAKVKWVRFAESSHLPQLEEPEEFLKVVSTFLLAK